MASTVCSMPPYNPLLQKDDIGKARPTCYDLPGGNFAYGRPGNRDVEGAREVSMHWCGHIASESPRRGAPDFIRLHRKAATAGITTPRDLSHFRREHDISLAVCESVPSQGLNSTPIGSARVGQRVIVPSDVIPGFTYGRKCRPSTPIREIISHRFGGKVKNEMQQLGHAAVQRSQQVEIRKIPFTNASRGHASAAKKAVMQVHGDASELFKLSKFIRIPQKVDTNLRKVGSQLDRDEADLLDFENDVACPATPPEEVKEEVAQEAPGCI